eukprot:TRINITY_DN29957_c0_g1_i1.p1 TRINITY_DN29957_c0_g1~~TRINITY_DN29957_c0_g1_i1.p1  ORF type:complete len:760 (+),score=312.68 TRINITY_DN29957_c0_g1_i1:61-2340(+)
MLRAVGGGRDESALQHLHADLVHSLATVQGGEGAADLLRGVVDRIEALIVLDAEERTARLQDLEAKQQQLLELHEAVQRQDEAEIRSVAALCHESISHMIHECRANHSELDAVRRENSHLAHVRDEFELLKRDGKQLADTLAAARGELEARDAELSVYREKAELLAVHLIEAVRARELLEERLDADAADHSKAKQELADLRTRLALFEDAAEADLAEFHTRDKVLSTELRRIEEEGKACAAAARAAESERDAHMARCESLSKDLAAALAEVKRMKGCVETAEGSASEAQSQLNATIADRNETYAKAEACLATTEEDNVRLKGEVAAKIDQEQALLRKVVKLENVRKDCEARLADATRQHAAQLESLRVDLREAHMNQLSELRTGHATYITDMKSSHADQLDRLKQDAERASEELRAVKAAHVAHMREIKDAHAAQLEQLQDAQATGAGNFKQEFDALAQERGELRTKVRELQLAKDLASERCAALKEDADGAKQNAKHLAAELANKCNQEASQAVQVTTLTTELQQRELQLGGIKEEVVRLKAMADEGRSSNQYAIDSLRAELQAKDRTIQDTYTEINRLKQVELEYMSMSEAGRLHGAQKEAYEDRVTKLEASLRSEKERSADLHRQNVAIAQEKGRLAATVQRYKLQLVGVGSRSPAPTPADNASFGPAGHAPGCAVHDAQPEYVSPARPSKPSPTVSPATSFVNARTAPAVALDVTLPQSVDATAGQPFTRVSELEQKLNRMKEELQVMVRSSTAA